MSKAERLYVLDLARTLAMVLMIQGHTLDALVTPAELDISHFPWNIWHFLRGLTAPIFLLLSGIVHIFATPREPNGLVPRKLLWRRVRWALTLMGIGYLMMFPAQRLWHLKFVSPAQWTDFFRVHILQLIGLTLLLVTATFAFTRSNRHTALIGLFSGIAVLVSAPVAAWVDWYRILPEPLAAYMSTERGSLFPFIPFAAYLFFGLPIGSWLHQLSAKERAIAVRLHLPALGLGLLSLVPLLTAWCQPLLPVHANPYHANPGLILLRLGLALLFIGATAWLFRFVARWKDSFVLLSQHSLFLFVGHLIILYGTPWFDSFARWYPKSLSIGEGVGIALVILTLCLIGIAALEYVRRYRIWTFLRFGTAAAILAFLLLP